MTAIEQLVFEILSADPELNGLVAQRVYPDRASPGVVVPYVVFQRIATDPSVTHDQQSVSAAHLDGCLIQLTAVAKTSSECAAIIYRCRVLLERSGVSAQWQDERSLPKDEPTDLHVRQADFNVWHDPD